MWLVGCFASQLFLGYTFFQGTSSFDQLSNILEMISIQFLTKIITNFYFIQHSPNNQKLELKTLKMYEDEYNIDLLDPRIFCIWNPINQVQEQSKVQIGKKPIIRDGHYGRLSRFTKEITRISFSFMFTASQYLQHPFLRNFQFNINEIIKQDLQQQ